ncbi:MAG: sarcosine oxidase subunit gamma [Roseobacter sp.]
MHNLQPLKPMGSKEPASTVVGGVTILENTGLALASVAARTGQETACRAALDALLQSSAPGPGQTLFAQPYSAIWMSQDQWLLSAPFETHEQIATMIKPDFASSASITEQTDGWVCFDISGDSVTDMFERLCAAPVRRLHTGSAQRTTIHHISCFIVIQNNGVRVLGPRSFAASLHHALVTAAQSVA